MFKSKKNKDDGQEGKTRGARDEFESLQLIILADKILHQKVLDKIKQHRALSSLNLIDMARDQHDKKEKIRRNRDG